MICQESHGDNDEQLPSIVVNRGWSKARVVQCSTRGCSIVITSHVIERLQDRALPIRNDFDLQWTNETQRYRI